MRDKRQKESGNALIYVLIAIALFAALSFLLGRQTDTSEANMLSPAKAELYATQLISHTAQTKSALDQMILLGDADTIDNMDFTLPTAAAFNTAPHGDKVYHPEGGGLNPGSLPAEVIAQDNADPPAGWYLGRFNNVEWTDTTAEEVILTAHQISQSVCEKINLKITGSTTIPALDDATQIYLIDDSLYTGSNADFDEDKCAACVGYPSLCVSDDTVSYYSFYTIVADQ